MNKNNWYVANDNGEVIGHDLSEEKAKILAEQMKQDDPNAGWEALDASEDE